jgi:hypothetical protein
VLLRERGDLIHVDAVVALAHAVLVRREEVAGDRDLPAVREVAAGGEAEADRRVAGAEERVVHREVRGRARVRLHVRVLDAEELLDALDAERLDRVDVRLALVVALARVALRVLVVEHARGGLVHRARGVVLARDEAHGLELSLLFLLDERRDLGVDVGKRGLGHRDPPGREPRGPRACAL